MPSSVSSVQLYGIAFPFWKDQHAIVEHEDTAVPPAQGALLTLCSLGVAILPACTEFSRLKARQKKVVAPSNVFHGSALDPLQRGGLERKH